MDDQKTIPLVPPGTGDGIESDYANNVYFVGTVWDLKVIFGELSPANQAVEWHTSITLPWAQAKLMAYYLGINIAAHEAHNGKVGVPEVMLPPEPPPIAEADKDNPSVKALVEFINESHARFIADQKTKG